MKMNEKGWALNSLPNGIHFCMGESQTMYAECSYDFLNDLYMSIEYVKTNPTEDPGDTAKIYCSTQQIPKFADSMLEDIGRLYMDIQTSNDI